MECETFGVERNDCGIVCGAYDKFGTDQLWCGTISTFGSDDLIVICKSDVCAVIGVGLRDCKSLQSAWCD